MVRLHPESVIFQVVFETIQVCCVKSWPLLAVPQITSVYLFSIIRLSHTHLPDDRVFSCVLCCFATCLSSPCSPFLLNTEMVNARAISQVAVIQHKHAAFSHQWPYFSGQWLFKIPQVSLLFFPRIGHFKIFICQTHQMLNTVDVRHSCPQKLSYCPRHFL